MSSVFGLNVSPRHRDGLTSQGTSEGGRHLSRHRTFANIVGCDDCFDDSQRNLVLLSGLEQCPRVLWKTRATKTGSRVKKLRPDTIIQPNSAGNFLHVCIDLLGKIGDLVYERDFRRQEGVCRIFNELGGTAIRVQNGSPVEIEGPINFCISWCARSSSEPTTIRSGCLKSWMAAPSRRNSGLETTATSASDRVSSIMRATSSPVPTGTVDLVMITLKPFSAGAISRAAA